MHLLYLLQPHVILLKDIIAPILKLRTPGVRLRPHAKRHLDECGGAGEFWGGEEAVLVGLELRASA